MYDQRNAHGPGTQVQRASAAGAPGKTTLTEQLNGGAEPIATAASSPSKKDLLHQLHHALHTIGEKIRDKISDAVAEAPEKLLNKLLKKAESKAEHTIKNGLAKGEKSCLTPEEIAHVEAAIHRTRMIAAFNLLKDLDKATLAESDSIQSHESADKKGKDLQKYIDDAVKAAKEFKKAMDEADTNVTKLQNVAVCQIQQFEVPQFQALPYQVVLPPFERPKPDEKPHVGPSIHFTPQGLSVIG
jgi:hypothetical protein